MSGAPSENYARYAGIHKGDLPAAVIITAVYAPLFLVNVVRSIRHPTCVLVVLAFFCAGESICCAYTVAGCEGAGRQCVSLRSR